MKQAHITPEFLTQQGFSTTIVERFWEKVFVLTYDKGCWLWLAGTDHNGYGVIGRGGHDGRMMSAHRVSWMLFRGLLAKGEPLLHSCDETLCVNPWHLKKGTQLDNVRDMIAKGRMPRGENRGHAKLTPIEVREMRVLYEMGHFQKELGKRFGVSQQTVSKITSRRKWAHL